MANLSTSGLEELVGGFDAIAELPDEVVLEMLVAEAEVIAIFAQPRNYVMV